MELRYVIIGFLAFVTSVLQGVSDYFYIEMVRANYSTPALLLIRAVERALD